MLEGLEKMKKSEYDKYKFDSRIKLSVFFSLLVFAVFLEIIHSNMAGEVIAGIIGLAGGSAVNR
jgi:hypothetical protein